MKQYYFTRGRTRTNMCVRVCLFHGLDCRFKLPVSVIVIPCIDHIIINIIIIVYYAAQSLSSAVSPPTSF